ncbi:hypothetical protein ACMYR3_09935 [Ampullimonas aquatilis]|uniref:hypothetical protein n=1 Tax=Ampullimonas aquatilis TaxID=1341549 RepID=UPI003C72E3F1
MLSFQSALIFLVIAAILTIFVIGVLIRGAITHFLLRLRHQQLAKEIGCQYIGGLTFLGKQTHASWRTDAFSDENAAHSHYTLFSAELALPKGTRFAIMTPELLTKFNRDNQSVMQKVKQTWQQLADKEMLSQSATVHDKAGITSQPVLIGSTRFKEQLCMMTNDPRWTQLVTPALELLWLDWPGMDPRQITVTAMNNRLEITINDQILAGCDHWRQFIQLGLCLVKQITAISLTANATIQTS